ncbi:metallophosphoesterase [Acidocella sp.]|uniref:metallophosphoesterase n=1 Tax=Acidocella sp. TaxID=50710 RepID=UPI0026328F41|nr:metallophosphoesterase [Acidocella sp.]
MIPPGAKLRVIGDVHGDSRAFAVAAETDRFVIQLGDLVDDGPDTPGALRIMFRLIVEKRGLFLLGNHEYKLARALRGDNVRNGPTARTIAELPEDMRARTYEAICAAPLWLSLGPLFFVHGAFQRGMLELPRAAFPPGRPGPLAAFALYGQTTGRVTGTGRPERLLRWIDDIPEGMTVYAGHDQRSTDGRPYVRTGRAGGTAIMLDTGAGKGGHLSWIDIDPE